MLMRRVEMAVTRCSGTGSTPISASLPRPAGSGLFPDAAAPKCPNLSFNPMIQNMSYSMNSSLLNTSAGLAKT